jgi:hypothetical protein
LGGGARGEEVPSVASAGAAGRFFEGLLPKSRMAMSMAMAMRETSGLEGWMMVYIPPDEKQPCEVMTTTHGWQMTMMPEQFNPKKR